MGQAKQRKLNGTYPEQTPRPDNKVNAKDAGRAFSRLYHDILAHLNAEFADMQHNTEADQEGKAYAALMRMSDLGAEGGFAYHEPLLLFASYQDHTGGWLEMTFPEKRAAARCIDEIGRRFALKGFLEYLKVAQVTVEGENVTIGPKSPWLPQFN